jgi:hypothetical protein
MADRSVTLTPIAGVTMRVTGDRQAVRHFRDEYGSAQPPGSATSALDLRFVDRGGQEWGHDHHKSVSWSVHLAAAEPGAMILEIALRGFPRWFGLSLVQGFVVEPVLSLIAPNVGLVLLPAAAIAGRAGDASGVDLLIGPSRTGKSSLSLRALAGGAAVLGDDQVLVGADGVARRFPRRLRLYDDISATAPAAWERLPRRARWGLIARRAVRTATRGRIAPSLALQPGALRGPMPESLPIRRVTLLSRGTGSRDLAISDADSTRAVARAEQVLSAQRQRLLAVIGPSWDDLIDRIAAREHDILALALARIPAMEVIVPEEREAGPVIASLARLLGLP